MTVEAVVFDWGGTLTPWRAVDPRGGWRRYADAVHPDDPARAGALTESLLGRDVEHWTRVRDTSRAFALDDVFAAAGIGAGDPAHETGLAEYRDYWTPTTHVRPEAPPMLAELRRRGYRLGLLSSTMWPGAWHEDWLRRDGVLDEFDAVVWSSDLAWTKPHPEAFRAVLDAVGIAEPARAVYVGDRPYDDVTGAHRAGMHTVWIPHSEIPAEQQVPTDVRPDAVAHELAEIPDLIAGW